MEDESYSVNVEAFDQLLPKIKRRQLTVSAAIFVLFSLVFFVITPEPVNWIIVLSSVFGFVIIFFAQKSWNRNFLKFRKAKYYLSDTSITLTCEAVSEVTINLTEICIRREDYRGTLLVTGSKWKKFDFYRPKNHGEELTGSDRVFIPKSTTNYSRLTEKIKNALQQKP